jgi:hypothetical protein
MTTNIITVAKQGNPGPPCVSATLLAFTMPPADSTTQVTVTAGNVSFLFAGADVLMQNAGTLRVFATPSPGVQTVQLVNRGTFGNATPGSSIPIGSIFAPAGAPGQPAFTTTTGFTMPTQDGATTVNPLVGNSTWMAVGQLLFIATAGWLKVTAIPDTTHVTLVNPIGIVQFVSPGAVIGAVSVTAGAGPQGQTGATGAGPAGSVGYGPVTGAIVLSGDIVTLSVPCTTSDRAYRIVATCVARFNTPGRMNDSWTQQVKILARNDAGVTTIVGAVFDDAIGNLTMATVTAMELQATTSGTTVNVQAAGGNTMVITLSADVWVSP